MRLSIIVPVFNTKLYLPRCFRSLLDPGLDESDYEIVVINDGSTDNSVAVTEAMAAEIYGQRMAGSG
jgi:glycosyltransferase involved in cell wall biosynthesis